LSSSGPFYQGVDLHRDGITDSPEEGKTVLDTLGWREPIYNISPLPPL